MRTYYIYKATNTINGKSYIGQTVDLCSRMWQHLRCYDKEDCAFHRAIRKFGDKCFEWEVLDECTSKEEAVRLEKHYIEVYGTYRDGYNENKGGAGGHNAKPVVCLSKNGEFISRYDSAAEAEKDGFSNTEVLESCKNPKRTCKGRVFMYESDYLNEGARQYTPPVSTSKKKIIQCDMDGHFLMKFDSVQEASEATGANRTSISGVLSNRYKSANGFIFVYECDFPIKNLDTYQRSKKGKKVAQVDVDTGQIIRVFDRVSDAGKALGVNYKGIHKVIDKENRCAFGYKWISQ